MIHEPAAPPQPLQAPSPRYPIEALRAGRGGKVVLDVRLATSGRVQRARVTHSSGDVALDHAAQQAVLGWTYPAQATPRDFAVPVRFQIDAR
nr:energy transducer TonB [Oleiagrimonas sp. C23AA]